MQNPHSMASLTPPPLPALTQVLWAIIIDMLPLLVILGAFLLQTMLIFMILAHSHEDYASPSSALFTSWTMLLLGDFDGVIYEEGTVIRTLAFFLLTTLVNIVRMHAAPGRIYSVLVALVPSGFARFTPFPL